VLQVLKKVGPQALGRSRGGLSSKIHLVCDRKSHPLAVHLTEGHPHDAPQLPAVMEAVCIQVGRRYRSRPKELVADKAYSGKPTRHYLRRRGIRAMIPERKLSERRRRQRGLHPRFDKETYKERNVVERLINHLKACRRITTRFEKLAACFLAIIHLAFIRNLLKRYFSDAPKFSRTGQLGNLLIPPHLSLTCSPLTAPRSPSRPSASAGPLHRGWGPPVTAGSLPE
jgi:transposase